MTTIILEGPDCGGKSTFAEWMADEKGAVLFHHGPYKGVQETAPIYAASLQHAIDAPTDTVVLDRSWYSELVYHSIHRYNDPIRISRQDCLELEDLAKRSRAVVINVQPDFATCNQRWMRRRTREYLSDAIEYQQVYTLYRYMGWFVNKLPYLHVTNGQSHGLYDWIETMRKAHYNV
jgi:thymidylate kinase